MSNFYERIAETARRFPERAAIEWIGSGEPLVTTYAELVDEAGRVAAWLTGTASVAPGDRVAILSANDARWVAAFAGILRSGAVVVPLDTGYSVAEVQTVLTDSGARILMAGGRHLGIAHEAAALAGPTGPRVVPLADAGLAPRVSGADAPRPATVSGDDAAVILYTSGTTADPKGVVLTHANLEAERAAVLSVVQATEQDVVLGVLPLFHALAQMANLWLPLTIGARVVYLETVSSSSLLQALETRGITILACVPQFFYLIHQRVVGEIERRGWLARRAVRLLLGANTRVRDRIGWNPGRRLFARVHRALGPNMRLLITGGSRFDPAIACDLHGLGVSLYNGYGLTETSGAATIVRPGDRFNTSVGPPLPGVEVRIEAGGSSRGEDNEQPEDGEVLIRGPIVMREYFRRPDRTAEALQHGWLRTGDLGRVDHEGRLHITGRRKEVIVLSSGKNVYPEEIEAHYRRSPVIRELCVLGLSRPDEPSAERLHAVVVPNEDVIRERGVVNVRELVRFELEGLSVALPPHKRILSFDVVLEPLARTTTGKLRRGEIEARALRRSSAPAADRPLSAEEVAWLAEGGHADDVAAIEAHLGRTRVPPDANLELDLGLDSMERIELLTSLEARRGRRVDAAVRSSIFTVRQLVAAVERAAGGDRVSPGAGTPAWEVVLAEPPDADLVGHLKQSKLIRALVIYAALRVIVGVAGRVIGLRISGRAHIPAAGPLIVSPNHQTYVDGFVVAAALPFHAFRRIFFVGAAEFFEARAMAWGARAINIVPLDPDANLVSAMRAAAAGLRLGKVLMLFPEGERTIDGSVRPFRKGAAILASHLDVPIVPVAIDGLFPLWPRGRPLQWRQLLSRARGPVSVAFGEPIQISSRDYAASAAALGARVKTMLETAGSTGHRVS
jgi:long-chain acyl-CoA synthetase